MKITICALLSGLMLMAFTAVHDYHVSILEINYSKEKSLVTMAHKIFIDDLEHAMELKGVEGLSIDLEKEKPQHIKEVIAYIDDHLSFSLGKEKVERAYVGFEWEDHHALWFYFQVKNVSTFQEITITNDLFIDLFPQQENIHYIEAEGRKETLLLTKDKTKGTVSF